MNHIYLDNSATTQVCPQAMEKAVELMTRVYGNPSSLHAMGFAAEQELTLARKQTASLLHAKPEEIFFTSGGTESNNLAIFGAAAARKRLGTHIVTSAIEHPSVLGCMEQLQKQGFSVTCLAPDSQGRISPQQLAEAINDETILVSLMLVNNEVGTIQPVADAAKIISRSHAPALLHVDAVQAFGKLPIHPARMGIDLLSISGHKLHAPKGVGALYVRSGVRILPHTFGGGQEKNLRPGTQPLPLIAAFAKAIETLPAPEQSLPDMQKLCDTCRQTLLSIPGITIHSPEDALPYVLSFSVPSVRSETMLHFLSEKGIFLSSGSACAKGKTSHVLTAMKLPRPALLTSLRVSFSRLNTLSEIEIFASALQEGLHTLVKGAF